jgi:hypothetical protein
VERPAEVDRPAQVERPAEGDVVVSYQYLPILLPYRLFSSGLAVHRAVSPLNPPPLR